MQLGQEHSHELLGLQRELELVQAERDSLKAELDRSRTRHKSRSDEALEVTFWQVAV